MIATISSVAPGQVDESRVQELKDQEEAARAAGFSLQPPVYSLGSRVNSVGVENFTRARQAFEQLPEATTGLKTFISRVAAEHRVDTNVQLSSLSMLPDGRITRGGPPLLLASNAFDALCDCIHPTEGSAMAAYCRTLEPNHRAQEVNHWIARLAGDDSLDKQIVLRHRRAAQPHFVQQLSAREVYALVTNRYNLEFNVDVLARMMLAQMAPGDCRLQLTYDGYRFDAQLLWHTDIQPERACAGEIFAAMAGVMARDDGTMSVRPYCGLHRNLCLNMIIVDHAMLKLGSKRHTGSSEEMEAFIQNALAEAVSKVAWFAEKWDRASEQNLLEITRDVPDDASVDHIVAGVLRGLLKEQKVSVPGFRRKAALELLTSAFNAEPQFTRAGIVNAVTRVAHTAELRGIGADHDMETAAAVLLASTRPFNWAPERELLEV